MGELDGKTATVTNTSQNQGTAHLVALGAQVMAKVIFIVDQGQSQGFMTRVQYNEAGPSGVHQFGLTLF